MKHAKAGDLLPVSGLLDRVRQIGGIRERTPGHFYFHGINVLHFHTDNGSIYCDIGSERLKAEPEMFEEIISSLIKLMKQITQERRKN
jgi:hypothetical protein